MFKYKLSFLSQILYLDISKYQTAIVTMNNRHTFVYNVYKLFITG